jgi:quercetin dioxygenase-like cupin family protein
MRNHQDSRVKFVRDPDLEHVEARFSYYRQEVFRKHTHETYAIGLVEQGITDFDCENERRTIGPGDIALINPEEVHACNPRTGAGLTYCMFYVETDLMLWIARDLPGEGDRLPCFAQAVVQDPSLQWAFTHLYTLMLSSDDRLEKEACLHEAWSRPTPLALRCISGLAFVGSLGARLVLQASAWAAQFDR